MPSHFDNVSTALDTTVMTSEVAVFFSKDLNGLAVVLSLALTLSDAAVTMQSRLRVTLLSEVEGLRESVVDPFSWGAEVSKVATHGLQNSES